MRPPGHRILSLALVVLALAAMSCSASSSTLEGGLEANAERAPDEPDDSDEPGSGLSPAAEEAAIAGMEETYWMLVDAYIEASSPPVNREHPVIEARMQGPARRAVDSLHRGLIAAGSGLVDQRNERRIIEIEVLSPTTGRIRDCSILVADVLDTESGQTTPRPAEIFITENFYELVDGVWKLDHWGDSSVVTSFDECPVPPEGPRDGAPGTPDPRDNL